jgi:hypothetical protein
LGVLLTASSCAGTPASPDRPHSDGPETRGVGHVASPPPALPQQADPPSPAASGTTDATTDGVAPQANALDAGSSLPGTGMALPAACIGKSFDLDALIAKKSPAQPRQKGWVIGDDCAWRGSTEPLSADGAPDVVDVEATVLKSPLAPGAASSVRLVFRNRTEKAATMVFSGCEGDEPPFVVLGAYDAQGDRADEVPTDVGCGISRGCMPWALVLRVDPRGTVTATTKYRAVTRRRDSSCREQPHGVLRKGDYVLHVRTPLIYLDAKRRTQVRIAETRLTVGP